ncbi:UNKNOWN [Stylonychia lemnae]|uniref:Transmembrane protein n=1 Tax=Stylonychia lemnae TaxID=5949 RepID=A0A078A4L4_STYLE|nr:UNKNOWN [Stylonychia lemnae]|eukprot:CDW76438.1 UNKNOWN [Stylonychia lemnae]
MILLGFIGLFSSQKMIKEFQQATYDFIDFKVNKNQVQDLAMIMLRVIRMICQLGNFKFSVEIIDKILELLKNLPIVFCADQIFMENILILLTDLKQFELGLKYSELSLILCERYQQPGVENDQYLKLKKRFVLFKYECSLQISCNYSRSELRQIEEDINSIETILGQAGDVQMRLLTVKQKLKPLVEKSNQAMLLKALGFGVLASGLVITAVIYFTKKRN